MSVEYIQTIDLRGLRFVELDGLHRQSVFVSEGVWKRFLKPFRVSTERSEQAGKVMRELDIAANQWFGGPQEDSQLQFVCKLGTESEAKVQVSLVATSTSQIDQNADSKLAIIESHEYVSWAQKAGLILVQKTA